MVWLITVRCYGTKLHFPPQLEAWERRAMIEPAYSLDGSRRALVMRAITEICAEADCCLLAAHVRTTHAHVVADFDRVRLAPAGLADAIKRRASRLLNAEGFDPGRRRRWARGEDARRITSVGQAVRYVVERQGEPLGVYLHPDWRAVSSGESISEV